MVPSERLGNSGGRIIILIEAGHSEGTLWLLVTRTFGHKTQVLATSSRKFSSTGKR